MSKQRGHKLYFSAAACKRLNKKPELGSRAWIAAPVTPTRHNSGAFQLSAHSRRRIKGKWARIGSSLRGAALQSRGQLSQSSRSRVVSRNKSYID